MTDEQIVPETVTALRDAARLLWKDEDDRASSLNARASGLTGFIGVILSLAAVVGTIGGTTASSRLADWVRVSVGIVVALALIVLVVAVFLAVWKVLLPRPGITISREDTDHYVLPKFTSLEPTMLNGYLVDAYTQALKIERARNDEKACWLSRSYKLLCAGLALVALAGAVATLDAYVGGDDTAGGRRAEHSHRADSSGARR